MRRSISVYNRLIVVTDMIHRWMCVSRDLDFGERLESLYI